MPTPGDLDISSSGKNWPTQPDFPLKGRTDGGSPLNSRPSGSVTISGILDEGETLTADNTLSDPNDLGVLTHQWENSVSGNIGTNSANYVSVAADVGDQIRVAISYTDGLGQLESKVSSWTDVIVTPTGGGSAYTATHYVAPFALVSGATSDEDTVSGTAFSLATSPSNPCTLGEAMANGVAGNQVQCAAGTYDSLNTGSRLLPSFRPTNSGTSLNPIIFFAEYPAAYNYGSTSLYSKIDHAGGGTTANGGGSMGASGVDYIVFDGFYAYEPDALVSSESGVFAGWTCNGVEFRRCVVDRGNSILTYAAGMNAGALYLQGANNTLITDCIFTGYARRTEGNVIHQNISSVEVYNSVGWRITNCYFENFGYAVYQKESDSGVSTTGTVSYNKFKSGHFAINIQQGSSFICHHNLVIDADVGFHGDGGPITGRPAQVINCYSNTFITPATPFEFELDNVQIEAGMELETSVFKDNIVYARSGWDGNAWRVEGGGSGSWVWGDWTTLDYNCYYRADAATNIFGALDFSTVTGIANWRTETGHEANAIVSDPEFTNAAADDFTLAANAQAALTGSSTSGPIGAYITGSEEIGLRTAPTY